MAELLAAINMIGVGGAVAPTKCRADAMISISRINECTSFWDGRAGLDSRRARRRGVRSPRDENTRRSAKACARRIDGWF